MKFKDLQIVNENIDMKPIKSKRGNTSEYAGVNEKIKAFRQLYPDGGIITKVLSLDDKRVVIHAEVTDDLGRILGSGTASKLVTNENQDTFIEGCESSAVGRALRFIGIGLENITKAKPIDDSITNLLELGTLRGQILGYTTRHKYSEDKIRAICERYKVEQLMDLNLECCRHYIDFIKKNGGDINE